MFLINWLIHYDIVSFFILFYALVHSLSGMYGTKCPSALIGWKRMLYPWDRRYRATGCGCWESRSSATTENDLNSAPSPQPLRRVFEWCCLSNMEMTLSSGDVIWLVIVVVMGSARAGPSQGVVQMYEHTMNCQDNFILSWKRQVQYSTKIAELYTKRSGHKSQIEDTLTSGLLVTPCAFSRFQVSHLKMMAASTLKLLYRVVLYKLCNMSITSNVHPGYPWKRHSINIL